MKHVTFAEKSLLIGDEAATVLLEYAAALAAANSADTVDLAAISSDGDDVVASFLLNAGSPLMAESSTTNVSEPDNAEAIRYMQERLRLLQHPPYVVAESVLSESQFDDSEL